MDGRPGRRCKMRRLWHLLEVVVLYVIKRIIDRFFDKDGK